MYPLRSSLSYDTVKTVVSEFNHGNKGASYTRVRLVRVCVLYIAKYSMHMLLDLITDYF